MEKINIKLQDTPEFQIGVRKFQKGEVSKDGEIEPIWVKKLISHREWKGVYSYNPSYCNMGEESIGKSRKVKIGFMVVGRAPKDCELLNDEELVAVDNYRKSRNVLPRPLKDIVISEI